MSAKKTTKKKVTKKTTTKKAPAKRKQAAKRKPAGKKKPAGEKRPGRLIVPGPAREPDPLLAELKGRLQATVQRRSRQAARAVVDRLETERAAGAEEDGTTFSVRAGGAYVANGWEENPYQGELRTLETGQLSIAVPPSWGTPRSERGGLVWSLPDAEVALLVQEAPPVLAGAREWIDVRRGHMRDGWIVVAGREVEHPQGLGVETGELCKTPPRVVRATRFLFVPPRMVSLAVLCPDAIPDARGGELVAAFRSICVRADDEAS